MTSAYCLDSDVIIWLLRSGGRNRTVTEHLKGLANHGTLSCSALSVMEVERGMRPTEEPRTRQLLRSLQAHVIDQPLAEHAAELSRTMRTQGKTMGLADAVIASTAIVHQAKLVTLNVRDFEQVPNLLWETVP